MIKDRNVFKLFYKVFFIFMSENKTIQSRLIDFQSQLPLVEKEANNPFFKSKYATLDSIQKAIQPVLAKCGLGYTQSVDELGLVTTLYDVDGNQLVSGHYPLDLTGKPQEIGSAVSYARRYSLCSFLGLIVGDEDDDGNIANSQTQQKQNTIPDVITKELVDKVLASGNNKYIYAFYKEAKKKQIDVTDYDRLAVKVKEIYQK